MPVRDSDDAQEAARATGRPPWHSPGVSVRVRIATHRIQPAASQRWQGAPRPRGESRHVGPAIPVVSPSGINSSLPMVKAVRYRPFRDWEDKAYPFDYGAAGCCACGRSRDPRIPGVIHAFSAVRRPGRCGNVVIRVGCGRARRPAEGVRAWVSGASGASPGEVGDPDPDPDDPVQKVLEEPAAAVRGFDRRTGAPVRVSGDPAAGYAILTPVPGIGPVTAASPSPGWESWARSAAARPPP